MPQPSAGWAAAGRLCEGHPGARVADFKIVKADAGSSNWARRRVEDRRLWERELLQYFLEDGRAIFFEYTQGSKGIRER